MRLLVKLLDEKHKEFYCVKKNYRCDSGFDLYCIRDVVVEPFQVSAIETGVSCQPFIYSKLESDKDIYITSSNYESHKNNTDESLSGYYLYARSKIADTPLDLANSVGIIDAGYTGQIIAKVRNLSSTPYTVKAGTSLFQLCSPDLKPFEEVKFVDSLMQTQRGDKGFGSTSVRQIPITSLYFDN